LFLYGYHPVCEALRHRPHEVVRVLVSTARTGRRREEIAEACERHRAPFEVVPERALAAIERHPIARGHLPAGPGEELQVMDTAAISLCRDNGIPTRFST
jgi:tRNA G18 (ribose-2'-O)-methylase SpoU